jgi:hypothetical protein
MSSRNALDNTGIGESYKSDTTGPPAFYYYDMFLFYPMSVTGIYVIGDAGAALSAADLVQTTSISVYYGTSEYPESNPFVTGNLD